MSCEQFRVLYADCPWFFGDRLPGKGRGAIKKYPCMSLSDIMRFPLPPMHRDSVLILWRVAAMPEEALLVCKAWGYTPKSEIVWVKTKRDGEGIRIGMGRYVRNSHETAIVAVRGRGMALRQSKSEPSVIVAPRGEHSAKPDAVHELIERLYPGPYAEIFARRERANWSCFGNELERAHP